MQDCKPSMVNERLFVSFIHSFIHSIRLPQTSLLPGHAVHSISTSTFHNAPYLAPKFCISFVFHFSWVLQPSLACVQTITKLWLVRSAKQRRDPCSGPPTDSTNYRKCVSNSPSTWLAITTKKTKAFFNWPIVARTQIWVRSWKSRTRISALFRRRS